MRWPTGLSSSGTACGIKPAALDLGVIVVDRPCAWAGVFTQNAAAAAPVTWCKSLLGAPIRAVVANSGNANACTGAAGHDAVASTAIAAADAIGCLPEEVLIASTGPIGVRLPVEKICASLPAAIAGRGDDLDGFATAIMTTDTTTKLATAPIGNATMVGVAKGAAMIAPNMATMLAFIATDAEVSADILQAQLASAVERTFNRISIDACESTNDSVVALATGYAGPVPEDELSRALGSVCRSLAGQIVRDAEGGTKIVTIRIEGAVDEASAVTLGRAVAASNLWRAAVHGADPNWGRVLAAIGAVDRSIDMSKVDLSVGPEVVYADGNPCGSLDVAAKAMKEPEFAVTCSLKAGDAGAEILTTDLSPEYVALNAVGTT